MNTYVAIVAKKAKTVLLSSEGPGKLSKGDQGTVIRQILSSIQAPYDTCTHRPTSKYLKLPNADLYTSSRGTTSPQSNSSQIEADLGWQPLAERTGDGLQSPRLCPQTSRYILPPSLQQHKTVPLYLFLT